MVDTGSSQDAQDRPKSPSRNDISRKNSSTDLYQRSAQEARRQQALADYNKIAGGPMDAAERADNTKWEEYKKLFNSLLNEPKLQEYIMSMIVSRESQLILHAANQESGDYHGSETWNTTASNMVKEVPEKFQDSIKSQLGILFETTPKDKGKGKQVQEETSSDSDSGKSEHGSLETTPKDKGKGKQVQEPTEHQGEIMEDPTNFTAQVAKRQKLRKEDSISKKIVRLLFGKGREEWGKTSKGCIMDYYMKNIIQHCKSINTIALDNPTQLLNMTGFTQHSLHQYFEENVKEIQELERQFLQKGAKNREEIAAKLAGWSEIFELLDIKGKDTSQLQHIDILSNEIITGAYKEIQEEFNYRTFIIINELTKEKYRKAEIMLRDLQQIDLLDSKVLINFCLNQRMFNLYRDRLKESTTSTLYNDTARRYVYTSKTIFETEHNAKQELITHTNLQSER